MAPYPEPELMVMVKENPLFVILKIEVFYGAQYYPILLFKKDSYVKIKDSNVKIWRLKLIAYY